ncbi:MAG: hypothetical protein PWQ57_3312 [Desulfovibrionales bacterium]|nr:hypothetical protein [Desulfovibrionales bacterium]
MSVKKVKLTIPQGSTYVHTFSYVDSDGDAVSLLNFTARMQFRESAAAEAALYEGTTENGHIVINGPAGSVQLKISAATTAAWTFTYAVYDLEIVSPLGVVTRLVQGSVKVTPEVTR